jgi:hypothetical protein
LATSFKVHTAIGTDDKIIPDQFPALRTFFNGEFPLFECFPDVLETECKIEPVEKRIFVAVFAKYFSPFKDGACFAQSFTASDTYSICFFPGMIDAFHIGFSFEILHQ